MLVQQPFFIGGIEDVDRAKSSAFGAAGMFVFTFVVSIGVLIRGGSNEMAQRRGEATRSHGGGPAEYGQVPTTSEGNFVTGSYA